MSSEELHPLKYTYDILAEECLERLDAISPPEENKLPRNRVRKSKEPKEDRYRESGGEDKNGIVNDEDGNKKEKKKPKRDLYELLKKHKEHDRKLKEFWDQVTTIPEWVDWEEIQRGQDVFYRYGAAMIVGVRFPIF
jgi:hypothetical protein